MNRRSEVLQVAVAIGVLAIGILVYLLDREPGSVYFIPDWISLANSLSPISGQIGHHLPTFVHVYVFILLTTATLIRPLVRLTAICFIWFAIDSLFEIAQIATIAQWIAGIVPAWFAGMPFLENTASYFLAGTFDILDLVSIAVGTIVAYLTIVINSGGVHHQQATRIDSRRQKHGYKFVLVVVLGLVGTVGSGGGGGGGGGEDGVGPLIYSGNTDPAVITTSNATTFVANIIGSNESADIIISDRAAQNAKANNFSIATPTQLLKRDLFAMINPRIIISGTRLQTLAAIQVDETESCDSGSVRFSGTLNNDGTGTVNVSFNNCQEGDSIIDGDATLRVDVYDINYEEIIDGTMHFSLLRFSDANFDISISGELRVELEIGTNTEITTINIDAKNNHSNEMAKIENLVTITNYDYYFMPSSYSESISGRIYDSEYGYIDISTDESFSYSNMLLEFADLSGQLTLTGATNTSILVKVLSATLVLVELDLDADTVYEVSGTLPWTVLSTAGSEPEDIDGDGLLDTWEISNNLDPLDYSDSSRDSDNDGLSNLQEYQKQTDPMNNDSDDDGMSDGWELNNGFNPLDATDYDQDADNDNATNLEEFQAGTDPNDENSTPADISITLTDSIDPVSVNTNFSYVLQVTNAGPGIATNLEMINTLPDELNIFSVSGNWWNCNILGGTVKCILGELGFSLVPPITITVTAPPNLIDVQNSVSVSAETPDRVTANNSDTEVTSFVPAFLSFIQVQRDGIVGFSQDVVLSPDGAHAYMAAWKSVV